LDNNGLKPIVDALKQVYNDNGYKNYNISLADFFALGATVGVTATVRASNQDRGGPM
jgi:hypothetical protein